jgi:hypothetical protein
MLQIGVVEKKIVICMTASATRLSTSITSAWIVIKI